MTDESFRPTRATRRGFLALAGCTAVAGCNGLLGGLRGDDAETTVDGAAFREVVSADAPTVPETVPVAIERAHLDESSARARKLLSSVPTPLGRDDVPNGAMRARLVDVHGRATRDLDAAADAGSRLEAMESLRGARQRARSLAASWAAVEQGLTHADVREDAEPIRNAIDGFRRRWRYVGADPVRAVLVHATIEPLVGLAVRQLRHATHSAAHRGPERRTRETPITVGETAGRFEHARAALDDAAYLYDRYVESLDDSRRLGSAFEVAGGALSATVEERRSDLPDGDRNDPSSLVDRDVGGTAVGSALGELYSSVDHPYSLREAKSSGQRASVVVAAHEVLVHVRAFESLRQRVEDGEYVTVGTVEDVRTLREDAVEAVESAVASGEHSDLDRRVVGDAAGLISYADGRIESEADREEVPVRWFERELGMYVKAAELSRATPPTSGEVAERVREVV